MQYYNFIFVKKINLEHKHIYLYKYILHIQFGHYIETKKRKNNNYNNMWKKGYWSTVERFLTSHVLMFDRKY